MVEIYVISPRRVKVKLEYRGEIRTTDPVNCFKDLVMYTCKLSGLEYSGDLPQGFDSELSIEKWFNFFFVLGSDIFGQNYYRQIANENDF